eukprot:gnl/Carplike_NY0171/8147_a11293_154.p1 GENE.gnl/Carplike_NY0171/8147_a11293_154~~gnl/Carplike_NY0171/8147_a11293_154.p1  ORF type:complete len:370 (+),score=80.24 gnl/Carplike_NY0171/8147_a11293_154:138-1112(+)
MSDAVDFDFNEDDIEIDLEKELAGKDDAFAMVSSKQQSTKAQNPQSNLSKSSATSSSLYPPPKPSPSSSNPSLHVSVQASTVVSHTPALTHAPLHPLASDQQSHISRSLHHCPIPTLGLSLKTSTTSISAKPYNYLMVCSGCGSPLLALNSPSSSSTPQSPSSFIVAGEGRELLVDGISSLLQHAHKHLLTPTPPAFSQMEDVMVVEKKGNCSSGVSPICLAIDSHGSPPLPLHFYSQTLQVTHTPLCCGVCGLGCGVRVHDVGPSSEHGLEYARIRYMLFCCRGCYSVLVGKRGESMAVTERAISLPSPATFHDFLKPKPGVK